jgi:hypothetical protein
LGVTLWADNAAEQSTVIARANVESGGCIMLRNIRHSQRQGQANGTPDLGTSSGLSYACKKSLTCA